MSTRVSKKHRMEWLAWRACRGVLRALPMRAALGLGAGLAMVGQEVFGWRKAETRRRIAQVYPEQPSVWRERVRREALRNLGRNFVELLWADRLDEGWIAAHVTEGGVHEQLQEARGKGKGVLLVIAHTGNWDLAATVISRYKIPICFIARKQKNTLTYEALQSIRQQRGGTVVDRDDPRLIRKLLAFLAENGMVVILVDIRARGAGEQLSFLGQPCQVANGLGLLAGKSGAEVVPVALFRKGRCHIWRPLPARRLPARADKPARKALLQSCLTDLGAEVRKHPESYFWFNKRWVLEKPDPKQNP